MKKTIIEKIKVSVKLTDDPESTQKAIVNLTIGPLKIKGFRIRPSEWANKYGDSVWVAPPSYKSRSGKWHRQFHCEDKKLWEEIQDKIYKEYNRLKEKKDNEIPIIENRSS